MVGKESNPIVTTVAPTIPVLAANNIPTNVTEIAKPPLNRPNMIAIDVNKFSAILDFSNIAPIKTNNGTANNVWLLIVPKIRFGKAVRKAGALFGPETAVAVVQQCNSAVVQQ